MYSDSQWLNLFRATKIQFEDKTMHQRGFFTYKMSEKASSARSWSVFEPTSIDMLDLGALGEVVILLRFIPPCGHVSSSKIVRPL